LDDLQDREISWDAAVQDLEDEVLDVKIKAWAGKCEFETCLDDHDNEIAEFHDDVTELKNQLSEEETKTTASKEQR
jgi:hypothetical protein